MQEKIINNGKPNKSKINGTRKDTGGFTPHMAQELVRLTNNKYYNAYRLIQTEVTHFTEMGRYDI